MIQFNHFGIMHLNEMANRPTRSWQSPDGGHKCGLVYRLPRSVIESNKCKWSNDILPIGTCLDAGFHLTDNGRDIITHRTEPPHRCQLPNDSQANNRQHIEFLNNAINFYAKLCKYLPKRKLTHVMLLGIKSVEKYGPLVDQSGRRRARKWHRSLDRMEEKRGKMR